MVVDLGCGSGILGILCLQAGAARVIGIDSTPAVNVARETYARAGLSDHCEFVRGRSYQVSASERADLIICDHVGYFGIDYDIVDMLQDARLRFLKPGGLIIPRRLRLMCALVHSPASWVKAEAWASSRIPSEYHWLRRFGINTKHAVTLGKEEILGAPALLGIIELGADNPEMFSWTAELEVDLPGVLHGLAGWFECDLAEGICMTNSPFSTEAIDRHQAFFPIDAPVAVEAGHRVKLSVAIRPSMNIISWKVSIPKVKRCFSHSTWQGEFMTRDDLIRAVPTRMPRLSRTGQARAIVLGYCDGQRTVEEIEAAVLRNHPDLFPSNREISRFVIETLAKDGE